MFFKISPVLNHLRSIISFSFIVPLNLQLLLINLPIYEEGYGYLGDTWIRFGFLWIYAKFFCLIFQGDWTSGYEMYLSLPLEQGYMLCVCKRHCRHWLGIISHKPMYQHDYSRTWLLCPKGLFLGFAKFQHGLSYWIWTDYLQ